MFLTVYHTYDPLLYKPASDTPEEVIQGFSNLSAFYVNTLESRHYSGKEDRRKVLGQLSGLGINSGEKGWVGTILQKRVPASILVNLFSTLSKAFISFLQ